MNAVLCQASWYTTDPTEYHVCLRDQHPREIPHVCGLGHAQGPKPCGDRWESNPATNEADRAASPHDSHLGVAGCADATEPECNDAIDRFWLAASSVDQATLKREHERLKRIFDAVTRYAKRKGK